MLLVLLSGAVVLMVVSRSQPDAVRRVREVSYGVVEGVQSTSARLRQGSTGLIAGIGRTRRILEENRRLKQELAAMRFREKGYYREVMRENQRLARLLEFQRSQPYELVPVDLVGYSRSEYFRIIYLGRGAKEGVERDMVVVNAEGLVGRVSEVYPHECKAMLITDDRSKVGVRDQRSRDVGILQGQGSDTGRLRYVLKRADVAVGDELVTSGLGRLFPEGIPVGKISGVNQETRDMFLDIRVELAVNFGALEGLFLIVP